MIQARDAESKFQPNERLGCAYYDGFIWTVFSHRNPCEALDIQKSVLPPSDPPDHRTAEVPAVTDTARLVRKNLANCLGYLMVDRMLIADLGKTQLNDLKARVEQVGAHSMDRIDDLVSIDPYMANLPNPLLDPEIFGIVGSSIGWIELPGRKAGWSNAKNGDALPVSYVRQLINL